MARRPPNYSKTDWDRETQREEIENQAELRRKEREPEEVDDWIDAYSFVFEEWCRLFAIWLDWTPVQVAPFCEKWKEDIVNPNSWFWHDGSIFMAGQALLAPCRLGGLKTAAWCGGVQADLIKSGVYDAADGEFDWNLAAVFAEKHLTRLGLTLQQVREAHESKT